MKGWVYILECSDATLYVGSTTHVAARIAQHDRGAGATYTRRRLPVRLVWLGEFDRIEDAFAFEKRVQGWSRAKKLALLDGDDHARFARLSGRGVKPSRHHIDTSDVPTIESG